MPRFVIDANVLVSRILVKNSVPMRAVVKAFRSGTVISSRSMLEELGGVLERSKFDRYLSRTERMEALGTYVASVEVVPIVTQVVACRDPRDNHVLEAAINGRADVIITGDVDLLALDPFHGVRIMTPEDFLNYLPSSP